LGPCIVLEQLTCHCEQCLPSTSQSKEGPDQLQQSSMVIQDGVQVLPRRESCS